MIQSLRAVTGEGDIPAYQRESAAAVSLLDLDSVPDELCRPATEGAMPHLDSLPFKHDCPVPVTDYVELSATLTPTSVEDL